MNNTIKYKDISGNRYGRLVVVEKKGKTKKRMITWLCLCDCGKKKIISGYSLRSGNTKSCGCLLAETASIVWHVIRWSIK